MKQNGIRRETNHKRPLTNRVAGGWGARDRVVRLWTLGRVCAMVSAVNCVRLMTQRPVSLKQIIY